ncbi:hypothetical protein DEO72_LG10g2682 [Vigna unguiculata]|uniref:Uncharacterized protein n=1 Tax=Vigna unguiculata TaxID=3917 RepID=A0A4D6NFX3_VIGUN|nr:hypothetical protein DEO72_LG10g2682 [Vigna unguiculata]
MAETTKIHFGFIGCTVIVRSHLRRHQRLPVVAKVYNYNEFVLDDPVVVYVPLPTSLHLCWVHLQQGETHVMLEKQVGCATLEHGPTQVQAGGEQHVDDVGVVEDNLVVVVHLVEGAAPYGVKDDIGRECDGVGDLTHNFGAADETKANFGGFRHLEI